MFLRASLVRVFLFFEYIAIQSVVKVRLLAEYEVGPLPETNMAIGTDWDFAITYHYF
jgi:hypothetical protein